MAGCARDAEIIGFGNDISVSWSSALRYTIAGMSNGQVSSVDRIWCQIPSDSESVIGVQQIALIETKWSR